MAATISFYNHTRKLFANGEVTLAGLKVMLLNGHSFNAAHTAVSSISGDEVHGAGWTEGGEDIDSAAITVVNTNESMLDGDDISVTATGGAIGPADGGLILAGTAPLFYIDFDGEETAGEGTPFNINWHADGIARWLNPS